MRNCLLALLVTLGALLGSTALAADWVPATSIHNDFDAKNTCPRTCGNTPWRGEWRRDKGSMFAGSCLCGSDRSSRDSRRSSSRIREVDAGSIFHQMEAERKCTAACGRDRWDGNWRTVSPGRSTCDCEESRSSTPSHSWSSESRRSDSRKHEVDAGPIFHQMEAERKCTAACGNDRTWDGNWRTVGAGRSTCDCIDKR